MPTLRKWTETKGDQIPCPKLYTCYILVYKNFLQLAKKKIMEYFKSTQNSRIYYLLSYLFIFIWKEKLKREERGDLFICWLTPQVVPQLEMSPSEVWSLSGYKQEVGLEVEELGLKLLPVWDACTTSASLTCYATYHLSKFIHINNRYYQTLELLG